MEALILVATLGGPTMFGKAEAETGRTIKTKRSSEGRFKRVTNALDFLTFHCLTALHSMKQLL